MVVKRFEIKTPSGKIAYGRTMSFTDENRTMDAIECFLELAKAHKVDLTKDFTLEVRNQ
jgi:hypothetical protein